MSEPLPEHAIDKLLKAASPLADSQLPPPPAIGRYRVIRELGRGAAGVVYEALDSAVGRRVAVKLLASRLPTGAQAARRFEREAQVAAALGHPNVVKLHDIGEHQGWRYLVMELVEGRPFREVMTDPAVGLDRKLAVLEGAARGVAAAHARGIVHRDLKPENIFVDAEGVPKVGDFGLAVEESGSDHRLTRTGAILGTPPYMSPEQLAGDTRRTGPASDVYALGAILHEILTGSTPFKGSSPADLYARILESDPPTPRDAPPALARICRKALQRDPAHRYAEAGAFADDVRLHLEGKPVAARVQPPRRLVAPIAGAVLMGLLAVGVISFFASGGPPADPTASPTGDGLAIDHACSELSLRTIRPLAALADHFQRGTVAPEELLAEATEALAKFSGPASSAGARRGLAMVFGGRTDEGLAEIDRAGASEPSDPLPPMALAHAFLAMYVRGLPAPPVKGERALLTPEEFVESGDLPRWRTEAARAIERAQRAPGAGTSRRMSDLKAVGEGLQLLAGRRFADAATRFRAVDELAWFRDEAGVLGGAASYLAGDPAGAVEGVERVRGRGWPRAALWGGAARFEMAKSAMGEGRDPDAEFRQAEEHLTVAFDADPIDMRIRLWRGRVRHAWGDWQFRTGRDSQERLSGAFVDLQKAHAMAPNTLEVRTVWGRFVITNAEIEQAAGGAALARWQEAVEVLEKLRSDPAAGPLVHLEAGRAWHGVAGVLEAGSKHRANALSRARDRIAQALRLDGADPAIRLAHGRVLRDLDRPAEALAEFRLALKLDPSSKEAAEAIRKLER